MRFTTVLAAGLTLTLLACGSEQTPTQPDAPAEPALGAASLSLAPNTWTPRAPLPFFGEVEVSAGVVTTAAGKSTVYVFGGFERGDGGTDFPIQAYDVVTDTWSIKASETHWTRLNGVGKIGAGCISPADTCPTAWNIPGRCTPMTTPATG